MSKATETLVEAVAFDCMIHKDDSAGMAMILTAIASLRAHDEARGMVLVPKEPSEDMLVNIAKAIIASQETDTFEEVSGRVYAAMIAEGGKQ